ncbi:MAG: hypothetical protein ACP5MX_00480 [Candidatus Micrarchaeia archaeon]
METIVIGLGGNALLKPSGNQSVSGEISSIKNIAKTIARLSSRFNIVITHGNGTQVGDELIKNKNSGLEMLPLYLLNAETQGSIGSIIETAINSSRPGKPFCTVVTHVVVDKSDDAFSVPTKPIGPFYTKRELGKGSKGQFSYIKENGMFRIVVPSPRPIKILEIEQIKHMLKRFNVICGGGGGIPVFIEGNSIIGANAVVDKDYTTQLIATTIKARRMILLTNADYVYKDFAGRKGKIKKISMQEINSMIHNFEEGTIRPKIDACIRFIKNGGEIAQIGSINMLDKIIKKESGTLITR